MKEYIQTMIGSRARWVPWIWMLAFLGCFDLKDAYANTAEGVDTIEVSTDRMERSVASSARYLRDGSGSLNLQTVKERFEAGMMEPVPQDLGFGFSADTIWLRFAVRNTSERRVDLVLDSSYPLIDALVFYELDQTGRLRNTESMGDTLGFFERKLWVSSFAYDLSLGPGASRVIYVQAQSTSSLSLPVKLYSRGAFTEHLHSHMLVIGIFYGIVLGLMIYNLFLYVPTRDRSYLDYAAMALANLCFVASVDGVNYMLVPDFVAWQQIATYVYICLFSIFGVRFSRGYFDSRETCPRFHKRMVGLDVLFCGYLVGLLLTQSPKLFGAILVSGMGSIVSVVVLAILRLRQGDGPAKI